MNDDSEISRIASSTGFSKDAVEAMADAMRSGGGSMAQFNHPELGGFGQWSAGGMLMIGDMFNNQLKGRVGTLADAVSNALAYGGLTMRSRTGASGSAQWWPEDLGHPASSGAQNQTRYAVFPEKARLAIERGGETTIYDTGEHRIGGVSQQQGGTSSLRFSSQLGTVEADDLRRVGPSRNDEPETDPFSVGRENERTAQAPEPSRASIASRAERSTGHERLGNEAHKRDREASADDLRSAQSRQPAETAPAPRSPAGLESSASKSESDARPSPERQDGDPIRMIRELAALKADGILTEEEFAAKKAELLSRI
ncbi:SHOCT domain-containing protein [Fulvimarina endophytica]|nr:SHOCT domain-containing protein [Fulvimarina endophytica]